MISQIHGTVLEATSGTAVIDVGGLGFELGISAQTASSLPPAGGEARLFARMVVREGSCTLFGFATREERSMFDRLLAVNGVGAKLALAVLSNFTAERLYAVVMAGDDKGMATVPGVGRKTAQRLILELKGAFSRDGELAWAARAAAAAAPLEPGVPEAPAPMEEATSALLSMGFTSAEAALALSGCDDGARVEDLLASALRRLGADA